MIVAALAMSLAGGALAGKANTWSIKADIIEACSCSMFCECYFNMHPEGMMCEFDNAFSVAEGHMGDVDFSGKKFWLSGDLGSDFTKGMKHGIVTFEPGTTKEQKGAIGFVLGKVYPVKWAEMNMDEAKMTWERTGDKGHATLDGHGEVNLEAVPGANGKPIVINNLKYFGADTNNGFELAYSNHHYKGFGMDYTHEHRNGFFIHIEATGAMPEAGK
ncbi:MAG: DUF1326 domain-containing protein [Fimbriimonas ginsengisoli]|uniref:DUF1326 domain-containing protein n=1 Tax=Fimbriimonas ginsengisoli TaxID=1005039 RepID=A0A931PSZ7_FIMGI|nr:DUF1326 domain-containing protein [Fimbriimonas ginsengisoli]